MKPVFFIATKLEAFRGRGENDGRTSSDFEDLVYVLNNRTFIFDEIEQAGALLRAYLKETFAGLLKNDFFDEWISVHLDFHEQRRVAYIIGGLRSFAEI